MWTKARQDEAWAAYAQDADTGPYRVAHSYEDGREIMSEWMSQNPWFAERFNTEQNRELIINEMEQRHYKVSLISIQVAITALTAQGLLKPIPVANPQPAEQTTSPPSDELRSWVNCIYNLTSALDMKFKLQRDPVFKKNYEAAIAAGLI